MLTIRRMPAVRKAWGHHFESIIEDLEEDYEKLKPSRYGVNLETTEQKRAAVEEAIGDILPVKMQMSCLYSVPTQMLVHFMSMENMMFAMYDYPDLFKEMMGRIADDTLAYYKMLEEKRLILPTTTFEGVGQGTWSFTTDLPGWDEWENARSQRRMSGGLWIPRKLWGFLLICMRNSSSPAMKNCLFLWPSFLWLLRTGRSHMGQMLKQAYQSEKGVHFSLV